MPHSRQAWAAGLAMAVLLLLMLLLAVQPARAAELELPVPRVTLYPGDVIGDDQLVDEMVISFTHTVEIDWMLPGVAPTGRRVEVPLVVIVRFRDGKLAHEHIYWDQASVLAQLGLIDRDKLPVAGAESARKALDPLLPSNALIRRAG